MPSIFQDGGHYSDHTDINEAITLAGELLGGVGANDEPTTFTVNEDDGTLVAVETNRRIVGVVDKQGHDDHDMVEFDATNAVLFMSHEDLMKLDDESITTCNVARYFVDWLGPIEVTLVDSVCKYFAVSSIKEITPQAFAYVKQKFNPQPTVERSVSVTVNLKISMQPGSSVSDFLENLDYSFLSNTPGVVIRDTEIIDQSTGTEEAPERSATFERSRG